ncbi:hypothetical protein PVAP13_8NG032900 [Panicum virgatum]|uniref:Uncharacterized protein n=1 Tax=Panicum virgatum TaxID=38727 RepID=A0A8T0PB13_PANVG|nr:hypothetical protein PVAP13_8NG032900 [Panicum virgatum]
MQEEQKMVSHKIAEERFVSSQGYWNQRIICCQEIIP